MLKVISSASVVVVPSRFGNQSYAIGEAMGLGRCVVASDAGGTPELIEDGTSGRLFRSGDAEELARVRRRASDDPDRRATLGEGARARAGGRAAWGAGESRIRDPAGTLVGSGPSGDFSRGERVFHRKFGYGTVQAVDGDRLDIAFDKAGGKKVIASFVVPEDRAG